MSQFDYAQTKAVDEVIIDQMLRIYNAPMHLRDNKEAMRDVLNEYKQNLKQFSKQILEKAWEQTKSEHETWIWPSWTKIKENCNKQKPVRASTSSSGWYQTQQLEQEQKQARAWTSAREFAADRMKGIAERIASWPDWKKDKLKRFIEETAYFQAQTIEGVKNVGYGPVPGLFGNEYSDERLTWWKNSCKDKMTINIEIPWLWFES